MTVVVASIGKVFATMRTLERPLASVDPLMSLPDVLVSKLFATVATLVQVLSGVNVTVLTHVVHGGVVLAAGDADDALLAVVQGAKAVALFHFGSRRRGLNLLLVDDVVRVAVGHVVVIAGVLELGSGVWR